jgi:ATP-dependent helicase/nuclease subunit A
MRSLETTETQGHRGSLPANTVVWASAGTGKTRKLVEVYIGLLEQGVDPMRIVAVTFTEKAAAEMRDRIRSTLYSKPGQWMKTIAMLPNAPISTIHGFCGMLLREHAFDLNLDPSFAILDEQRSLDFARESARDTIRDEIRSGNEEVEQLFGDFGLENLVETIVSAGYWLNSLGVGDTWLDARVDAQRDAAAELESAIAYEIKKYGGDFQKIGELADEVDAKKVPRHPLRKRDESTALLPKIGQIAGVETAERLARIVKQSSERFRQRKRAANALDFDDLLLGVRDLLRDHPSIRFHYQNHFQALLVDEFQDTDEVQAEIISLLAADPDDANRFARGKLMIVGDPKQSIYRFRRARVTVFFRLLQRILDEGGMLEHLRDNYRSAPPIGHFSNLLCQTMMDGEGKRDCIGPLFKGDNLDLSYRIRFSDDDMLNPKSDSTFLGITYVAAEPSVKAAQGREMEAEAIARLLKEWKSSGRIQSWKEVAVLLRAMSNVEIYVGALEAHGIPVYIVEGTAFYQKSEVSDLIAFLELVLHPTDALLRAIVATSPLFGIAYEELWRQKLSPETTARQDFDEILHHWAERRDSATAAEILQDVIRKTNFDVVLMAQKNGPQRLANVGKLIEITRGLARQGTTALDEIVRHLRDRARDTSIREPEAQIVSQTDDVVRVLTVHQAKGLEFDIVIIPDLAARTGRNAGDRAFFSDQWGILVGASYGLHRKPLPHSLILEEKLKDEDQQYEEEKRLLYVAITRARKMLVLGEGFSKQAGPWLQWIERVLEALQPEALEKARDGKTQTVRLKGSAIKLLPASQLNIPEQLEFTTSAILIGEPDIPRIPPPRIAPSLEMTPSDLGSLNGCFRFFQWTRILGKPEPGFEPTGDTPQMRMGSLAHKILEHGETSPEALAAAGLSDLNAVLASPEWQELMASLPERELPFLMNLTIRGNDCWVRGRMDAALCFDGNGPAAVPRVVDYKYAMWREGDEGKYDIQMTAYALALMKAMGTPRAMAELWYLKTPVKIIRREFILAQAEQKLTELLSKYIDALTHDEWPAADRSYCDRVECGFRDQCWGAS